MPEYRPFAQVDVFSAAPYLGNPVAVILDATGLDADAMQQIARWTNLSETTFVLPSTNPEADYRVRIFTPGGELPFAGHPTLGTAHAWRENGGTPRTPGRIVQECAAGLIEVRDIDGTLAFAAPPTVRTGDLDADHLDRIAHAFGIDRSKIISHQWVDNGPGWAVVRLATAQEVLDLDPDLSTIPDAMIGAIGDYPDGAEHAYEMRTFAPGVGVTEDPVCGSMNASVAQWLSANGSIRASYKVSQGCRVGRAGTIAISVDDNGSVWVGGGTTTCLRGEALT